MATQPATTPTLEALLEEKGHHFYDYIEPKLKPDCKYRAEFAKYKTLRDVFPLLVQLKVLAVSGTLSLAVDGVLGELVAPTPDVRKKVEAYFSFFVDWITTVGSSDSSTS